MTVRRRLANCLRSLAVKLYYQADRIETDYPDDYMPTAKVTDMSEITHRLSPDGLLEEMTKHFRTEED